MLHRWVQIEGDIVSGAGRGRTMKIPTLNLQPENELIPKNGVYVTRVSLEGGPSMNAVTNIGTRPTFNETGLTIETFVLNENVPEDVNNARLSFLHRLRDERKFNSADALRHQIGLDTDRAQKFFRRLSHHEQIGSN
jgi:riboflavin kinase/FMN adenylyltransferase